MNNGRKGTRHRLGHCVKRQMEPNRAEGPEVELAPSVQIELLQRQINIFVKICKNQVLVFGLTCLCIR